MKKSLIAAVASIALSSGAFAIQGTNSPYSDPAGDINVDGNTNPGNGILDILGMEVTNNATDITFTLSLNGNISTTDWGNYTIGFSTGSTASTNTGNGWARPINLNSPIGGMDYWIGSWVNGGGGAQLWSYSPGAGGGTGGNWSGPAGLAGFSLSAGATSTITYTLTLASLGLADGDTFYFDAYSTGGPGPDGAVDALANPNVSITTWQGPYTSSTTGDGGFGLNAYTVPEPSTYALLALGAAGLGAHLLRRRRR